MQEVPYMLGTDPIPLEISVDAGRLLFSPNLVLYVDILQHHDSKEGYTFVSSIYETAKKDHSEPYPIPDSTNTPVLHSSGNRVQIWQATFALIDLLLGKSYQTGYRSFMDRWLLKSFAHPARTHFLCCQIRHQGGSTSPNLPETRLSEHHGSPASVLVSATSNAVSIQERE